jgi:EsV-1-7 cysteine-rich motif
MPRVRKHRECQDECCGKQASFNVPGETLRIFCATHATEGMVNVVSKRCEHPDCDVRPSFNVPGEVKGIFCKDHATEGMVDVVSKRCEHPDCDVRPNFNVSGEVKGIFCKDHATEGMVNVKSKRCEHPDCEKQPAYNVPGEVKGIFCKDHATEGMVDVKSKRCEHPDCDKIPSFNVPGETKGIFCATHATEGMVNVVSKRCEHPDCDVRPSFNVPGETKGIFCVLHKTPDMEHISLKMCSSCGLKYHGLVKGLCVSCNPEAKKRALRKEHIVEMFLRKAFPYLSFIRDKSSGDIKTCTGKFLRPDFVLTLEDRVIIVECDEHQHWTYAEECEISRMINLTMVYGGLPVFFIRYNPDSFKVDGESQKISTPKKHLLLKETIEATLEKEPTSILDVTYLFYDSDRQSTLEQLLKNSSIAAYSRT